MEGKTEIATLFSGDIDTPISAKATGCQQKKIKNLFCQRFFIVFSIHSLDRFARV